MILRLHLSALERGSTREHLIRFALGGLATVVAGVVADVWGPVVGGLFLAFPAIFCASATLIEKHERERKAEKGLRGEIRGRRAAALDASGAGLGAVALGAFGAVIWRFAPASATGSLLLAAVAWLVVALALWRVRRKLRCSVGDPGTRTSRHWHFSG